MTTNLKYNEIIWHKLAQYYVDICINDKSTSTNRTMNIVHNITLVLLK